MMARLTRYLLRYYQPWVPVQNMSPNDRSVIERGLGNVRHISKKATCRGTAHEVLLGGVPRFFTHLRVV